MLLALSTENALITASVLAIAVATIAVLPALRSRQFAETIAAACVISAPALLFAAIVIRWWREGQGPFLTIYEVLLSNLFSLGLIFAVVYVLLPRLRNSGLVVLPFLLMLGLWLLTSSESTIPLPATFNSYWLWLHVFSGKIFLGFAMLGAAISVLLLAKNRGNNGEGGVGSVVDLDRALWQFMAVAFVMHSFMLVAGAVWAYSAWGRYWAWDPLETWSLLTWLCLGITLHLRVTFRMLPAAWLRLGVVVIFVLAFLTFFGVPFLSPAPHKGVM